MTPTLLGNSQDPSVFPTGLFAEGRPDELTLIGPKMVENIPCKNIGYRSDLTLGVVVVIVA